MGGLERVGGRERGGGGSGDGEIKALGSGMGFTAIWEQDVRPQARGRWGVERKPPA